VFVLSTTEAITLVELTVENLLWDPVIIESNQLKFSKIDLLPVRFQCTDLDVWDHVLPFDVCNFMELSNMSTTWCHCQYNFFVSCDLRYSLELTSSSIFAVKVSRLARQQEFAVEAPNQWLLYLDFTADFVHSLIICNRPAHQTRCHGFADSLLLGNGVPSSRRALRDVRPSAVVVRFGFP